MRNGYPTRRWETRAGTIELGIPKLRSGSYFPDWLIEPRRRAEQATLMCFSRAASLSCSDRVNDSPAATRSRSSSGHCGRSRIPLSFWLAGNAISQVGNTMTILAGPWFVLQTTGSAAKTGIVAAALAIGAVIPAVLGGPIVDRLGFRRASIAADFGSAVLIGAVPVVHLTGLLQFWHLAILVFLLSSINAQGDTARYALVPALAQRANIPIERANGLDRAAVRFGQVSGSLLGGLLIAWIGATNVLFVDTGTFTASALLALAGIPRGIDAMRRDVGRRERRYSGELREGLRFLRRTPAILGMALVGLIANIFDKSLLAVIAPVYAKTVYGSAASLGFLVGAFGVGALSGSLVFGSIGGKWPRRLTFLTCFTAGPLVIYGTLATTPPLAHRRRRRRARGGPPVRPDQSDLHDGDPIAHATDHAGTRLRNGFGARAGGHPSRGSTRGRRRPASGTHPHDRRHGSDVCRTDAHDVPQARPPRDGRSARPSTLWRRARAGPRSHSAGVISARRRAVSYDANLRSAGTAELRPRSNRSARTGSTWNTRRSIL
jgi:MFS family permease